MKQKQTILVVDDVPDDIVIVEEILKNDYQVKAATNGESALKLALGDSPPDLIILDILMPGMNGFEVCRKLKEDIRGSSIPVIFLTAKVMAEDEKTGFELGAVDYIRKPIDPDVVKMRVKSHLERKDQALRVSEIRYRRLFETAQDGIMIVDTQTGTIIDVNPSLAALMGISLEEFLGKKIGDLEFLTTILDQQKSLSEAQRQKYIRYKNLPLKTFDGRSIYIEFTSNVYQVDHRDLMQINIREITDLVEAEHERDKLSEKLTHYLSTSPTITYSLVLKDGMAQMRWISENVREVFGYSPEEVLAPNWWFRNVNSSDRIGTLGIISDLAKGENASREYRLLKKDRSTIWVHDEMRLLPGKGPESEIVGTITDITERKKAEEEIHLKSAALDSAANAVVITDREGVIRWANPAFGVLTGYSNAEAIGKKPGELVGSGKQDAEFHRAIWDTILSGKVWNGRLINRRKSGDLYDEEMTITPVFDESNYISNFIAIKRDITDNVLAQKRLESALRQREELLREIHHRVNNNMQVIIGLLNLSFQDIEDASLRDKLDDITRRIHAMAIIHEEFYKTEDLSRIDFSVYIHQMIENVRTAFPKTSKNTFALCEEGQALLSLEQAIPAGLIVEELLTNALKFAFTGRKEIGAIQITQTITKDERLAISVSDDGVGLPSDFAQQNTRSLGMTMIQILAEQLKGNVAFEGRMNGGVTATLSFPFPDSKSISEEKKENYP
jgi:PAS domain S-box-containing protein